MCVMHRNNWHSEKRDSRFIRHLSNFVKFTNTNIKLGRISKGRSKAEQKESKTKRVCLTLGEFTL